MIAALLSLLCQVPRDREFVEREGGKIVPTEEKEIYTAEWFPEDLDTRKEVRILFTLHGSKGHAESEVKDWHPYAKKRGFAIVALQWWLGGDRYLQPREMYKLLDQRLDALRKEHASMAANGHLLHGFSRGSANAPGLARIDRETKKGLFVLFVCNSGAWPESNPPPYMRDIADDAFAGQRFVGYFGGKDEESGETAVKNGRALRAFIEKRGGKFEKFFEVAEGRHGSFHRSEEMMNATLDLWLK